MKVRLWFPSDRQATGGKVSFPFNESNKAQEANSLAHFALSHGVSIHVLRFTWHCDHGKLKAHLR